MRNLGTNEINYLYDAAGIKLRKQTRIDYAVEKTMDYIGNFVYENNEDKISLPVEIIMSKIYFIGGHNL